MVSLNQKTCISFQHENGQTWMAQSSDPALGFLIPCQIMNSKLWNCVKRGLGGQWEKSHLVGMWNLYIDALCLGCKHC